MKSVKGTETEKNLMTSFANESQARMRYTYYASTARKEGYEQIAAVFAETADQEAAHAKRMFKYLEGGQVNVDCAFPAGVIATTADNLKEAAEGEEHEYGELYPAMAKTAEAEGFPEIAAMYRAVAVAEVFHGNRYRKLRENIQNGAVFERPERTKWRCRKCGYIHEGPKAPQMCPSCQHAQAFFEIAAENF